MTVGRQARTTRMLPGEPPVAVEREVACRMSDGVTLFADIYRPVGDGPCPVILMRLPYDKTQAENVAYAHPAWYARRGYIVVVQDVRGTGSSEGVFYPFRDEAQDGYDTIVWVSQLPGADGRVGTYGFSYAGATQLLPATLRPPGLTAICPGLTGSQYYEGWTYNQGALALAFAASWATNLGQIVARHRRDDAAITAHGSAFVGAPGWYGTLPLASYPPLMTDDTPFFRDWLSHPTYDDYWRRWSIDEDYGRIAVPALHIGGWYDVFLSGTVKNFVGLRLRGRRRWRQEPAKTGDRPLDAHPVGAAGRAGEPRRGAERRRRLADCLVRPRSEGEGDRRPGRAGDALCDGREPLARFRRLAAERLHADGLVPALARGGRTHPSVTAPYRPCRRVRNRPICSHTTRCCQRRVSAATLVALPRSRQWDLPIRVRSSSSTACSSTPASRCRPTSS